jgi:hypothetical protein
MVGLCFAEDSIADFVGKATLKYWGARLMNTNEFMKKLGAD